MNEEKVDLINHPPHYKSEAGDQYEHFKVVKAWKLSYCLGCATKYIKRAGLKDGSSQIDDLKKAIRYIEMELENIETNRKVETAWSEPQPSVLIGTGESPIDQIVRKHGR